jgi:transketolase
LIISVVKNAIGFGRLKYCLREAFGKTLIELGKQNPNIVSIDCDTSRSTKSNIFAKEFSDRFYNFGIAEQNALNVASGMAREGKTVFISGFSSFLLGRGWEIIRNNIAYDNLNVKIVGTHTGLSLCGDGGTHQALEDIAIMRCIPNMKIYAPADDIETKEIIKHVANEDGPCYVRLPREPPKRIHDKNYKFNPHFPDVCGNGKVVILSHGVMLENAFRIQKKLKTPTQVINCSCIKPLPNWLKDVMNYPDLIVTIEDHNIVGGLGSAVSEFLHENHIDSELKIIGVNDKYGTSARNLKNLHKHYGLDLDTILGKICHRYAPPTG